MKILFLHGWQSTLGGRKPTYLKDQGHTVLNPKLPEDDFDEAVSIAQTLAQKKSAHLASEVRTPTTMNSANLPLRCITVVQCL